MGSEALFNISRETMLATPGVYQREFDKGTKTRFISLGNGGKPLIILDNGTIIEDHPFYDGPFRKISGETARITVE